MPLFGLIPKKKQSTSGLNQHKRRTSNSSSSVYDPHPNVNFMVAPPGAAIDYDPSSSASASNSYYDALPPTRRQQGPSSSQLPLSLSLSSPSSSTSPSSSPSPIPQIKVKGSAVNTTPPTRSHRTGGARPSLESIEPFGVRRIMTSSPSPSANHNSGPAASNSVSLLGLDDQLRRRPRPRNGTGTGDQRADVDDEDEDLVLIPPSRSTVFGVYEHTLNRRSGYSTQSLPEDALAISISSSAGRPQAGSRSGSPGNGKLQRPSPAMRQAAATAIGTPGTNERWEGLNSNANPNSSPRAKSKVFGWFSFRSSKSGGGSSGASSSSMGTTINDANSNGMMVVVPATSPPPPPSMPNGDIAERVKRLPLSPPDSPTPSPAAVAAGGGGARRVDAGKKPSLSPLADVDDSASFRVTNFRHVSPTSTSSSGHLLLGNAGSGPGGSSKKRTKSASSFTSASSRKAKSSSKPPSQSSQSQSPSPPKSFMPIPNLPSPKLSFFNSTSSTSTSSLTQQHQPQQLDLHSQHSATPSTFPYNHNTPPPPPPPSSMPLTGVGTGPRTSRPRNDSMTSESGSQKVTAAAFRQATQARRSSTSLGSGSPLLVPATASTVQLVNASPSSSSMQGQGQGQGESRSAGRTSVDSLFLLPPAGQRSQTPTSMKRGTNGNGNGPSPLPSPTATSFRSSAAGGIRGEGGKDSESPPSSTRTFIPGHARSRSSTSDITPTSSTTSTVNNRNSTGSAALSDFASMTTRLNSAMKAAPKEKNEEKEMGVGGDGLGRQDTITQRSVSATVLPVPRFSPVPSNASIQHARAGSGASALASASSPLARPSSPTARPHQYPRHVPGASRFGPSASARAYPPRSQSALASYARSPASRSTPAVGSVSSSSPFSRPLNSLGAPRPNTIVALSKPDVDSDTSESTSEADSDDDSDDGSEDDAPLQQQAQPRPPRPGTSMSTRTTATAKSRLSVPLDAENVGKSGLPRPTALSTPTTATTTRTGQGRSSTMPSAPLLSLTGKTIAQTSRGSNTASSATSFKKPTHAAASRSVDALSFPTSSPSNSSPSPMQRHSANILQHHHHHQSQPQGPFAFAAAANGVDGTPSPASSSIGDSSSGKLPVTPRDGSELGWGSHAQTRRRSVTMAPSVGGGGGGGGVGVGRFDGENTLRPHMARSELGSRAGGAGGGGAGAGASSIAPSTARNGGRMHAKRHSVTFASDETGMKEKELRGILKDTSAVGDAEVQRRDRRRSEARAAIEVRVFSLLFGVFV